MRKLLVIALLLAGCTIPCKGGRCNHPTPPPVPTYQPTPRHVPPCIVTHYEYHCGGVHR